MLFLPRDVEEHHRVHSVLLQQRCEVLAVALQGAHFAEILPLPLQEVLAACLPVEHLVAKARVELLRVRLYWKEAWMKWGERNKKNFCAFPYLCVSKIVSKMSRNKRE